MYYFMVHVIGSIILATPHGCHILMSLCKALPSTPYPSLRNFQTILAISLSFASGVMLYVSFAEIYFKSLAYGSLFTSWANPPIRCLSAGAG